MQKGGKICYTIGAEYKERLIAPAIGADGGFTLIVALEEAKQKLVALRAPIKELGAALRLEETRDKVKEMESRTQDPAFWNNTAESSKVLQAIKQGQDKITAYDKLCARWRTPLP